MGRLAYDKAINNENMVVIVKIRRYLCMLTESMKNKYLAILSLALLLTFLFYFIDPREFLENLGYATLAALSLVELIEIVLKKVGE